MSFNNPEPAFKFDTILKSIFGKAAKIILTSFKITADTKNMLNAELAALGEKLIPDFICEGWYNGPSGQEPCLIHFEFQRHNDPDMLECPGEYLFRVK